MEKWKKTTLNFIRRVSKSIVKCCSVEFPWSAVYYKFFCLPKQFFIFLFFFSEKNLRNKKINWCGLIVPLPNPVTQYVLCILLSVFIFII